MPPNHIAEVLLVKIVIYINIQEICTGCLL